MKTVESASPKARSEDGRNLRSKRSREAIVDAVRQLVAEGNLEPTSRQISERAGVTMRTLFRQFQEITTLYREIFAAQEADIIANLQMDIATDDWRANLDNLLERRATGFEQFLPYILSTQTLRHRYPLIEEDAQDKIKGMREVLRGILPKDVVDNHNAFAALENQLSWSTWTNLRQDQGLSTKQSVTIIRETIGAILDRHGFGNA